FEPIGYIGWAASPSRVTRPKLQRGSGSRSTIGNSNTRSAPSNSFGTSSQGNFQSAKAGANTNLGTSRFQSSLGGVSPGTRNSAIQLSSARPSASGRVIG